MAIPFSKAIAEIKKKTKKKKILFCLDFDGTLTPIRRNPASVKPSLDLLRFLKKAARLPHCKIAIISGRGLKDLRKKIPVPGIILIGSHGLEWNIKPNKNLNRLRRLRKFKKKWQHALSEVRGVHFENKPFSFVLHYRRCPKLQQAQVVAFFMRQQDDLFRNKFQWTPAHRAFEVFESVRGRKEHASQELLHKLKSDRMIVAGDDATDFEMLTYGQDHGWAVTVGFSRAGIKYFAKGPGELVSVLNKIIS